MGGNYNVREVNWLGMCLAICGGSCTESHIEYVTTIIQGIIYVQLDTSKVIAASSD